MIDCYKPIRFKSSDRPITVIGRNDSIITGYTMEKGYPSYYQWNLWGECFALGVKLTASYEIENIPEPKKVFQSSAFSKFQFKPIGYRKPEPGDWVFVAGITERFERVFDGRYSNRVCEIYAAEVIKNEM